MEFESTVSRGLQTHIPSHIARHLGLKIGDKLRWIVSNGKVEVKKKEGENR